ncbi:hypothetical protein D3C81_1197710 [compost metagenome]
MLHMTGAGPVGGTDQNLIQRWRHQSQLQTFQTRVKNPRKYFIAQGLFAHHFNHLIKQIQNSSPQLSMLHCLLRMALLKSTVSKQIQPLRSLYVLKKPVDGVTLLADGLPFLKPFLKCPQGNGNRMTAELYPFHTTRS